jgi:hypothetical protein
MLLRTLAGTFILAQAILITSCGQPAAAPESEVAPSVEEFRSIAREAYTYGFPMVEMYKTLYKQAIDSSNSDFKAAINRLGHSRKVASPADRFVVTPNSDTPYSYAWMDVRQEPVVITMPAVEEGRYYSVQLIDLYTHNFGYLGTRNYGNKGGDFMITGPGWTGEVPEGISATIACETNIFYALFRTQLFSAADLANVHSIQDAYQVRTLSAYQGKAERPLEPVEWPTITEKMSETPDVFRYMDHLLQFCPTQPSEVELMARFAKLGIGTGTRFDATALPPDRLKAVEEGIAQVWSEDMAAIMQLVNAGSVNSGDIFGTREFLKNNYLYRFAGAKLGLFGNSREEALYPSYFVDAEKTKLNGAERYELRFEKDQLPPANAFWSLTMYDGVSQFLVENPIDRYLLNSTTLEDFTYGKDGSLTIHVQASSPGKGKESNWLPAPTGPFYVIMRIYLPRPEVFDGTWKMPQLQRVSAQG